MVPCNVLIYDYPGFGKSTGSPNEKTCYAAAESAYRWLIDNRKIPSSQLYLMGQSLGCAMACELASKYDHRALILLSPFTTIRDIGQEIMAIFPVRWLMSHHYDNRSKLQKYTKPLLIAHGTSDEVIPFHHGKDLYEAADSKSKTFQKLEKGTHNDVPDDFFRGMKEFVAKLVAETGVK